MEALLDINHCVAVSVGISSRGRSWGGGSDHPSESAGMLITNTGILHQACSNRKQERSTQNRDVPGPRGKQVRPSLVPPSAPGEASGQAPSPELKGEPGVTKCPCQ